MDHQAEDALQSIHAQTAHIQNRILQMACRGEVRLGVMGELAQHADLLAETCRKLIEDSQP